MESTGDKITTVCIFTCNRPESLRLALSGLIENLNYFKRTPRILVSDDSDDAQHTEKSKEILSSFASLYPGTIEFMDRNDRKEMAIKLAQEKNIPEEVLLFGLLGDKASLTTIGSSQNSCFLKTRGEKVLLVDDDVVYKFFSPTTTEFPLFSVQNELEYTFLNGDESLPETKFVPTQVDFVGIHESTLGKSVGEISSTMLEYAHEYKIIDTYMGSYGDSPMQSHISLLLLPQVHGKLDEVSPDEYEKMKSTHRIAVAAPATIAYQGPMCITMVMGVDNRDFFPPFMPNGRGQDLVCGSVRWKAFPLHLSGHLPFLIGHERPTKEARSVDYDAVAEMTKMNRVISSLISALPLTDTDPYKNMEQIGQRFVSIADKSEQEFSLFMLDHCFKLSAGIASYMSQILQTAPVRADFWKKDIESMIAALTTPDSRRFIVDISKDPKQNNMKTLQKWMLLYGQLLQNWHKLQ